MAMTDAELAELEALCQAATPGPWKAWDVDVFAGRPTLEHLACSAYVAENAAFIAAAREALPALIAEVRRLRELNVHPSDASNFSVGKTIVGHLDENGCFVMDRIED